MNKSDPIDLLAERERIIKQITNDIDKYNYEVKLMILKRIQRSDQQVSSFIKTEKKPIFDNVIELHLNPLIVIDRKILKVPKIQASSYLNEYIRLFKRRNNYLPIAVQKLQERLNYPNSKI